MPRTPKQDQQPSALPALNANWNIGPRNPAWDALWRRILSEAILPSLDSQAGYQPAPSLRRGETSNGN